MRAKDLREKKLEELKKIEEKLRQELTDSYFEMRMGKLQNVREPRKTRKDLAVLLTVIKEKEKESNNLSPKDDAEDKAKGKSKK